MHKLLTGSQLRAACLYSIMILCENFNVFGGGRFESALETLYPCYIENIDTWTAGERDY